MEKKFKCPVCEKHFFETDDDYRVCPVCGWENDGVQNDDHDYAGGANKMSVNQARIAYAEGRKVI